MKPLINGVDPFYRVRAVHAMFDQSELEREARTLPLRPFQESIIACSTLYRFVDVYAPSQSGKSTAATALAAEALYEFPGIQILVLSTTEKQAARLLQDIRNKYVKCHRVPELRELNPKGGDSTTQLILKESGSSVIALPHSMQALTGNPARLIILDEMARWNKEDAREIYAEAIARMGDKPGFMLINISTFFGESIDDPTNPNGYRGNFFHYKWSRAWNTRSRQDKDAISLRFTYHISPNLTKNIQTIKQEMLAMNNGKDDFFNEHYLGIPRKMIGKAIYGSEFSPSLHVVPDSLAQQRLNDNEPLFLCIDPGYRMKAAVLGQVDLNVPRLTYLRTYTATNTTIGDFLDQLIPKVNREFPGHDIMYFMDIAANQVNEQTAITNAEILASRIGYRPIMQKQPIEPGVEVIRSFMRRTNGFQVSDHASNKILIEAFESGLVCEERNGIVFGKYVKDGYYEHVGDAARYAPYYLTAGLPAESTGMGGPAYYTANSPYDTGGY